MKAQFSFEDLAVWNKAVCFCEHVIKMTDLINTDRKHYRLVEQLEAASASVAANIISQIGMGSRKSSRAN